MSAPDLAKQQITERTYGSGDAKPAWFVWIVAAIALSVHFAFTVDCANRLGVTHDEYWHLPVGVMNLTTGRFDYDNLNPPLVRMWAALPVVLTANRPEPGDENRDPAAWGDAFLRANGDNYHHLYARGRWMIALLSVLTGVVLTIWSRALFGNAAACVTVLLWSSSPTVLMSASLVTTDLAAAFFFVATLYALWKFAQQPSWKRAGWFGLWLGLAQLAKFTSLLLYPTALIGWFVLRAGSNNDRQHSRSSLAMQWLAALGLSLVVLNAGYLFRGSFSTLGSYTFASASLTSFAEQLESCKNCPVPLPRDYLEGLDRQRHIMESPHPVYLDGVLQVEPFEHYYLMTLWYKVPHAVQLLALLAVLLIMRPGREPRLVRTQLLLLVPSLMLLTLASFSSMQLGLRYLLPVVPLMILFVGQTGRWIEFKKYRIRSILVAVVVLAVPLSLRYHPHHLAYFNELAGGPRRGREHLIDSNIDWGQDLRALKEYLDANEISEIGLAYFGMVPPAELGIEYHLPPTQKQLPPSQVPPPGLYAVSVNFLQGRPHTVRDPDGQTHSVGPHEFSYFRRLTPIAHIGYSMDVYQIPQRRTQQ